MDIKLAKTKRMPIHKVILLVVVFVVLGLVFLPKRIPKAHRMWFIKRN